MLKIEILCTAVALSMLICVNPKNLVAQLHANQATIVIAMDEPLETYEPMVFGGFIEHLGKQIYGGFFEPGSALSDEQGYRLDVIEAVRQLKVPVIRWPGGCFVDSYHWRKGVGPRRQPYNDDRWGVLEPNTFGTHEFIELCRRLEAEPYICQNSLASIDEMADWVEYCNGTSGNLAELRFEFLNPKYRRDVTGHFVHPVKF